MAGRAIAALRSAYLSEAGLRAVAGPYLGVA